MSSVIADAEARLARGGKQRILLWGTSLKTAIYDEGEGPAAASDHAQSIADFAPHARLTGLRQDAVLVARAPLVPTHGEVHTVVVCVRSSAMPHA